MSYNWPTYERNADWDDLPHTTWKCEACQAENSCVDGECQFCDGHGYPHPSLKEIGV